jgi:hypothetical protein
MKNIRLKISFFGSIFSPACEITASQGTGEKPWFDVLGSGQGFMIFAHQFYEKDEFEESFFTPHTLCDHV